MAKYYFQDDDDSDGLKSIINYLAYAVDQKKITSQDADQFMQILSNVKKGITDSSRFGKLAQDGQGELDRYTTRLKTLIVAYSQAAQYFANKAGSGAKKFYG